MSTMSTLGGWLTDVKALDVSLRGITNADANANMLVFPLAEAQASGITPEQLSGFLTDAYLHFCRTVYSPTQNVCFYCWHDEASGTLRMSLCETTSATSLPFSRKLEVVDSPTSIAFSAIRSRYAQGIPFDELVDVEECETEREKEEEFVLPVFARMLAPC